MFFFFSSGTLYRPEKPAMFDDDNTLQYQELPSRRSTTVPPQSRPILPVPIVYH